MDHDDKQSTKTSASFRLAMRQLAGGVCAITVGSGVDRTGFVATSVNSLSVAPPTLLLCVNRSSSSWPFIQRFGAFSVNVLGRKHLELSQQFAGKDGAKGEARYSGGDWITSVTGAPVLADAIVALDCTVEEQLERHSHAIIIGRVQAVSTIKEEDVLVYLRGGYGVHQPL